MLLYTKVKDLNTFMTNLKRDFHRRRFEHCFLCNIVSNQQTSSIHLLVETECLVSFENCRLFVFDIISLQVTQFTSYTTHVGQTVVMDPTAHL